MEKKIDEIKYKLHQTEIRQGGLIENRIMKWKMNHNEELSRQSQREKNNEIKYNTSYRWKTKRNFMYRKYHDEMEHSWQ